MGQDLIGEKRSTNMRKPKKAKTSLSYLISAARKIWRWSAERRQVLSRCKLGKGWKCELCGVVGLVTEKILKNGKKRKVMPVQVDHIDPVGEEPVTWLEVGPWLKRLFCAITNLQCICRECHQTKTNKERSERKEAA